MSISRVYKIINDYDDLVYIGSTAQILCKILSNLGWGEQQSLVTHNDKHSPKGVAS